MSAPPSAEDRRCHADPDCHRTPRFQAQLHRADQEPSRFPASKTLVTCADHLGDTVQALARWASATGFGNGVVQFSVVDTRTGEWARNLPAFPFAAIHLPA